MKSAKFITTFSSNPTHFSILRKFLRFSARFGLKTFRMQHKSLSFRCLPPNLKINFSFYVSGPAIIIHSTSKIINFTLKISFIGTQKYEKNMKGKKYERKNLAVTVTGFF